MKEFKINDFLNYRMFLKFVKKFKVIAFCHDIDLDLYFEDLDYINMYLQLLFYKKDFRCMTFNDINEFLSNCLYEYKENCKNES